MSSEGRCCEKVHELSTFTRCFVAYFNIYSFIYIEWASQVASSQLKNLPPKAGDARDEGSISGLGRTSGVGNGKPFQYSCLKNPMDREALRAAVHGVTKSQT